MYYFLKKPNLLLGKFNSALAHWIFPATCILYNIPIAVAHNQIPRFLTDFHDFFLKIISKKLNFIGLNEVHSEHLQSFLLTSVLIIPNIGYNYSTKS